MSKFSVISMFFLTVAFASIASTAEQRTTIYDEALVPKYELPNPLIANDGSVVTTATLWESVRRAEVLEYFQREMFGRLPKALCEAGNHPDFVTFREAERCDNALNGRAIRKQIEITFHALDNSGKTTKANLLIYIPKGVTTPVPVFATYNFNGNHTITDENEVFLFHLRTGEIATDESTLGEKDRRGDRKCRWDIDQIIDAGYALATMHYMDIAFDDSRCMKTGIFALYGNSDSPETREGDEWGAIAAWAWGMSRVMDYIETDPQLDEKRVAVMGHSRLGKTSLWTGATDQRFALTISNDSGCGGAALSRRDFGETVERINRVFPYWFCKNFRQYGTNLSALPMDEHELIALMAPRAVYVASAEEDQWADPYGEYLSCYHAVPVYQLYFHSPFDGLAEPKHPAIHQPVGNVIGYHIRAGVHDVTSYDWEQYIRFANKIFK